MKDSDEKNQNIEDDFELADFKKKSIRLKLKNAKNRLNKKIVMQLSVLSILLLLLTAFFSAKSVVYYFEMRKNANTNEVTQDVVAAESAAAADYEPEANTPPETFDEINADNAETLTEPNLEQKKTVLDKIKNLRETFSNDDIVAYLKIDGTNIDYAVVQAEDNEFYLERDLYSQKNVAGSIFMDYECDPYELSKNTIIYGHNMRNGSMFHNIRYFTDWNYYNEHRFISLTTPYEETTWEIFSFYKTGTDFYYIQALFPNDKAFETLVHAMKEKSIYDTKVDVSVYDKVLTLSTCSNTPDDARYVINAKLIGK